MGLHTICVLLLCVIFTHPVVPQWVCLEDGDCSDVPGTVCTNGACVCPTGQQIGLAGCIPLAPYHASPCVEDHQCSRLLTMFECRRNNDTDESGWCTCQEGYHYFQGRCWPSSDFGAPCTRDEQCHTVPRNPYSLQCAPVEDAPQPVCVCADGYYQRQRGECRQIGYSVGDGCVVNEDCQFDNGVCDISSLRCVLSTSSQTPKSTLDVSPVNATAVTQTVTAAMSAASHGVACNPSSPCAAPLECSLFGACVCPVGYYLSGDGLQCNAELGSRSTAEQCVGLLAEVRGGICTCPPNFFFQENMRDCVKVTRQMGDSCMSDESCRTFGAAARCGPPGTHGLRTCECDTDVAVWDDARQMCRLFAGIGETCVVNSDCLAGEVEINCVEGTCACPDGLTAFQGLCVTTGLELGDACQVSMECTETPNTVCAGGVCSCDEGYQAEDEFCAPIIGGSCTADSDCVIANTTCVQGSSEHSRDLIQTCQCRAGFVAYDQICWEEAGAFGERCNVTEQCTGALGEHAICEGGACDCQAGHHHRDGQCWPVTGLFEACSRTSQCFLQEFSERTVCRNSICQCSFDNPYSEQLDTCSGTLNSDAAVGTSSRALVILLALTYFNVR